MTINILHILLHSEVIYWLPCIFTLFLCLSVGHSIYVICSLPQCVYICAQCKLLYSTLYNKSLTLASLEDQVHFLPFLLDVSQLLQQSTDVTQLQPFPIKKQIQVTGVNLFVPFWEVVQLQNFPKYRKDIVLLYIYIYIYIGIKYTAAPYSAVLILFN